jgi:hypothetical protein
MAPMAMAGIELRGLFHLTPLNPHNWHLNCGPKCFTNSCFGTFSRRPSPDAARFERPRDCGHHPGVLMIGRSPCATIASVTAAPRTAKPVSVSKWATLATTVSACTTASLNPDVRTISLIGRCCSKYARRIAPIMSTPIIPKTPFPADAGIKEGTLTHSVRWVTIGRENRPSWSAPLRVDSMKGLD